jgi:AcrR family transcriptional regulator
LTTPPVRHPIGALYHQFRDKEDLALVVVEWVDAMWRAEVGPRIERQGDPLDALLAFAAGHAVFCRRDARRGVRDAGRSGSSRGRSPSTTRTIGVRA